MKVFFSLGAALMVALLAAPALASSDGEAPAASPLRPLGECLRADQVMGWKRVDDQRVVVKAAGGKYFDVMLKSSCPALAKSSHLLFRDGNQASAGPTVDGRICGDLGDAVIPRTSAESTAAMVPCYISSIRPVAASDELAMSTASK